MNIFKYKKIKKEVATKPFYKKYMYRVKMKLLDNFYDKYLDYALNPENMAKDYTYYHGHGVRYTIQFYPSTKEELVRRTDLNDHIFHLVKMNEGCIKVRHDTIHTTVYITSKELYDLIVNFPNFKEFAIDVCEPAFENYEEVKSKLSVTQEIRKCLYYERHRFKVTMVAGHGADLKEVVTFRDMASNLDNVYISPNLADVHKRRYWQYSSLAVACDDEETASYLAMIGGDMVVSVKKAVLVDELK